MKYLKMCSLALIIGAFSCKKSSIPGSSANAAYKKLQSERCIKSSAGTTISYSFYQYNPNGLLSSVVITDSTNNGSWTVNTSTKSIEYNAQNKCVKESH